MQKKEAESILLQQFMKEVNRVAKHNQLDDGKYTIKTPLCKMCLNRITNDFDLRNPLKPTLECKVFGEIPRPLLLADIMECDKYEVDSEIAAKYQDL